jgi:hypothetical protein
MIDRTQVYVILYIPKSKKQHKPSSKKKTQGKSPRNRKVCLSIGTSHQAKRRKEKKPEPEEQEGMPQPYS